MEGISRTLRSKYHEENDNSRVQIKYFPNESEILAKRHLRCILLCHWNAMIFATGEPAPHRFEM
jgi:hypothetical protein